MKTNEGMENQRVNGKRPEQIKLNIILKRLDEVLNFPYGSSKNEVKKFFKIEKTSLLDFEETVYLIRFVDNILLEFGYDEEKEM